jgi:uncharacterized membrane protein
MFNVITINLLVTLLIILPTFLDGVTQAFLDRESNNPIRLISGFFAGLGLMSLISIIGKFIGIHLKLYYG